MKRKGFTLIEVLMATLILTGAILIELSVLPRGHAALKQGREHNFAFYLSERLLEELQDQPFSEIQSRFASGPIVGTHNALILINGEASHVVYRFTLRALPVTLPGMASPDPGSLILQSEVEWSAYAGGAQGMTRVVQIESAVSEGM